MNQVHEMLASTEGKKEHRFSFDYNGMGNFHQTMFTVASRQEGLELSFPSVLAANPEPYLAAYLGKTRGFHYAKLDLPINQTQEPGYFAMDVKAACEVLGIPVTTQAIDAYFASYSGQNNNTSRMDQLYGAQPTLWQDKEKGITVSFVAERIDYKTDEDLDKLFGHENGMVWGPIPKDTSY